MSTPSYHDLYITTADIPRTSIFNLPFSLALSCTRSGGWELWSGNESLVAGEYAERGLRLDVSGHMIVDSLIKEKS